MFIFVSTHKLLSRIHIILEPCDQGKNSRLIHVNLRISQLKVMILFVNNFFMIEVKRMCYS